MPDPVTITTMHRWFAVECNNRAWDLTAQPIRTPNEDRELLECAYAAAYHWAQCGTPLNEARADTLLAKTHALLSQGQQALHHARRALEYCRQHEADCEPWDVAFAHLTLAHVANVLGDATLRDHHRAFAEALGKNLTDDEERQQFQSELAKLDDRAAPGPGLMEG